MEHSVLDSLNTDIIGLNFGKRKSTFTNFQYFTSGKNLLSLISVKTFTDEIVFFKNTKKKGMD